MKKLYPLLSVLFLIYWGCDKKPERNEIVSERHPNGLKKVVSVFEGTGINEVLVGRYGFYESGLRSSIILYKNNEFDGLCTWWYESGQKVSEITYKGGEVDGFFTSWYENGRKSFEGTYKDGKRDGLCIWWYENGQKKEETTYKFGKEISKKEWNEDGSVKE